jgi:hypothetical protein
MEKRIEPWQAAIIYRALFPGANYLVRLRDRIIRAGFDPNDEICRAVIEAHNTMQALGVRLHYRSCKSGVGQPAAVKWPRRPVLLAMILR